MSDIERHALQHPLNGQLALGAHNTSRKVDSQRMRQANRALALGLIRVDPTLSRAELARVSGLSQAAISGIVDELIHDGLVREEQGFASGAVGRPPLRLVFQARSRLALGIALGVRDVRVALVDLGGEAHAMQTARFSASITPEAACDITAQLAHDVLAGVGVTPLLGVGMAAPGMMQWPDGVNLFSPNLGWRDAPLRALMEQRLGRPVLVDNEVRALALAESHYGVARSVTNAVFLDASYGVGGALILDGALYRGAHGAAGEFGHNVAHYDGPQCGCGNYGCLEVYASASGLVARASDALDTGGPSLLTALRRDELTFETLSAAAALHDALAARLVERAATYLGLAIANAVDNWDPELVTLSGHIFESRVVFDGALAVARRAMLETGRARVRLRRAELGSAAKLVGAATLVIASYLAAPI